MTAADLFEQLAAEQVQLPGVARRHVFGRAGLNVRGTFFAFLNGDRLVLKLPAATASALVASGAARVAVDLSPSMRKWISVPTPVAVDGWRQLMQQAHAHAATHAEP